MSFLLGAFLGLITGAVIVVIVIKKYIKGTAG
jgi:hypothetical protein